MDDEKKDIMPSDHSDYKPVNRFDASAVHHLSGMYQNWFLDYASYVILERAVPHIEDGLKPVQRRILHSMKRMDDGRFNKVANIVGHTMQFHPHGDASIGDALVQMGQKDLLVDCQGNWGNILTGDRAAAPRYIEARLSKFALDVVFNPKTTDWQLSYDGRNKEPITLPAKFPLLLAQGAEGIAVGLSSKILPHNLVEICDAAIAYLRGEEFHLYPDFPTGGSIDVAKYNDGQRGGTVKVRAKIEKLDQKTIVIREIPFSKTTSTLIDSILKALEKGKIKAKKFEQAKSQDEVVDFIDSKLEPFKNQVFRVQDFEYSFHREITRDDILRLLEIKMQRILKYNKDKADELIVRIKAELAEIEYDLAHMTDVTIHWFEFLREKYGKDHPRRTEIRSFDTIEASKVVEANQKLYINRAEGFIGTGLKKDEFVCNCSDIDDIIVFFKDGKYKMVHAADKIFVGKNILHVQVFKKNDKRTIYNVVYRDGKAGAAYIKRFFVPTMTAGREYDCTQGTAGSRILYFTANPNGEAEVIKVTLEANPRLKRIFIEKDFSEIAIKGRASKGNLLTRNPIHRIGLKSHGHSTLGGRKVWYDPDVNRLNYDEHGRLLGEFFDDDSILVVLDDGNFYISTFDANNHYEDNIKLIEKWDPDKVWTAALFDADNANNLYLKRFRMEATKRWQNYIGENPKSELLLLTDTPFPRIEVDFAPTTAPDGSETQRPSLEIDAEEFIAVKGFKAKGKRVTTFDVQGVKELEPTRFPEPEEEENEEEAEEVNLDPDAGKSQQQVIDEMTGQLNIFTEHEDL